MQLKKGGEKMRGGRSYCDACGDIMFSSEVNMSYNNYRCTSCGNTFSSHTGSNCYQRLEDGRQRHYDNLIKALEQAKKLLKHNKREDSKEKIEMAEKRMERAVKDVNDFRQEEIVRVSKLLPANSPDELIKQCSPFGTIIFNDVKSSLNKK